MSETVSDLRKTFIHLTKLAMDRSKSTFPKAYLWYDDPLVSAVIYEAQKLGWVLRTSHTQVEWTEAGIEAFHELCPKVKFLVTFESRLQGTIKAGDEGFIVDRQLGNLLVKDEQGRVWVCKKNEVEELDHDR